MNASEKRQAAVRHIEAMCSEIHRLTGKQVNHEKDARVHVISGEMFLDGRKASREQTEPDSNYLVRWARYYEANFSEQLAEAQKIHGEDESWVSGLK